MAQAIVFLVLLAVSREVRAAFENPLGSHFFHYPPVKELMLALGMVSVVAPRCAYSTAPYGQRYKKAFKFVATGTWIQGCVAKCKCLGKVHLALTVARQGRDGKVSITGIQHGLRESGSYLLPLGRKIEKCASLGQPLQRRGTSTTPGRAVAHQVVATKRAQKPRKKQVDKLSHASRPAWCQCQPTATGRGTASSPAGRARKVGRPASSAPAPSWLTPSTAGSAVVRRPAWLTPGAGPGR